MRVLLVDDDPSLLRALTRALHRAGFGVSAFASVEDFLRHGEPVECRCLVLDVDLPDIGLQSFRQALVAAGSSVPIIFITALEPRELGDPLSGLAPTAVLQKPFSNHSLLTAVERACHVQGRAANL